MKKILRVSLLVFIILWMTLIFHLSNETAAESSDTSGGFSYKIAYMFYPEFRGMTVAEQSEFIDNNMFYVRKAAHFTLFAVLGALSYANFEFFALKKSLKNVYAFFLASFYAVTDEFHQKFVEGRSCELRDWIIDSLGVLTALLLINLLHFGKRGIKMRKKELLNRNLDIMVDLQSRIDENENLRQKLDEQLKLIDNLNDRIADLQNMLVTTDDSEDAQSENEQTVETEETESSIDYGAMIIGKVLLSAAEYCGRIKSESETAASEAVETVFAKTEEIKAEILSIVSSESEDYAKKQLMDREYRNAVSYFDRLVSRL